MNSTQWETWSSEYIGKSSLNLHGLLSHSEPYDLLASYFFVISLNLFFKGWCSTFITLHYAGLGQIYGISLMISTLFKAQTFLDEADVDWFRSPEADWIR